MFKKEMQNLQRTQLSNRLQSTKNIDIMQMPPRGWIYTIRTSLGMTLVQLGRRLGVSPQAIAQLEKREADGQITVARLREALDAMGVKSTHSVFSSTSLQAIIQQQAERKAREIILRASQSMSLENQKNSDKRLSLAIREKARQLEDTLPSSLWD